MANRSLLDRIERAGNRLPNPTILFVWMCGLILLLSTAGAIGGFSATHPVTGESLQVINLLSVTGLHRILSETVANFVGFAPVGTVLVAIMGIGVAEHSGLLSALLRATVLRAPKQMLSFAVVLAGVFSSLAADVGYVVLIPLAAMIFQASGRHPLGGIAAAFAGVSGGYSANLLISPLDAILAGLSTEAATLVQPNYVVSVAANYYFIIVSTLLVSLVGTLVTEQVVLPRLARAQSATTTMERLTHAEKRGLTAVALLTLVFVGLLLWGLLPQDGVLRNAENGSVLQSPFIRGIVTLIAFYAALAGIVFGKVSGSYERTGQFVEGMERSMATMAGYLVLMFFAAQFVSYFAWSNLGSIVAIHGASLLQGLDLRPSVLLVMFIIMAACINLFIGSASAKWALLAPIFVPMLMLLGITPEATQMAYRIGDSSTNIITPLMPYFGVVVAFAQRYDQQLGIGTLVTMMLPYSVAFLLSWSALLLLWALAGWPLGPGANILLH